ncbi:hypothetical protein KUF71_010005 [Frankliniella fusca]|uniref:Uncharacterized protein n=1 Tax=Frankliniella fusca TaxID=407009 RepID=A0AAE1HGL8_9NEOP|nr:hypothetical protein KUF71_010005 [Frankliniella fusca]
MVNATMIPDRYKPVRDVTLLQAVYSNLRLKVLLRNTNHNFLAVNFSCSSISFDKAISTGVYFTLKILCFPPYTVGKAKTSMSSSKSFHIWFQSDEFLSHIFYSQALMLK